GDAARLIVLEELQQHVEHPEERPGRLAARVGQRRQGVERPVDVRGAVDEDQVGGARHGSVRGAAGRLALSTTRYFGVPDSSLLSPGFPGAGGVGVVDGGAGWGAEADGGAAGAGCAGVGCADGVVAARAFLSGRYSGP